MSLCSLKSLCVVKLVIKIINVFHTDLSCEMRKHLRTCLRDDTHLLLVKILSLYTWWLPSVMGFLMSMPALWF